MFFVVVVGCGGGWLVGWLVLIGLFLRGLFFFSFFLIFFSFLFVCLFVLKLSSSLPRLNLHLLPAVYTL